MAVIVLLISISLAIALGFLISFLWNMRSGQYDDTYSPSVRMLFDDKPKATGVRKKDVKQTLPPPTEKNSNCDLIGPS